MYKKTITYVDYNDEKCTEDCYFNLKPSEIVEMKATGNDLASKLQEMIDKKDGALIMKTIKDIVLASYGEKTADGKHFMKKDENGRPLSALFEQSEAYSVLFMELCSDPEEAVKFISGVLPISDDQRREILTQAKEATAELPANAN